MGHDITKPPFQDAEIDGWPDTGIRGGGDAFSLNCAAAVMLHLGNALLWYPFRPVACQNLYYQGFPHERPPDCSGGWACTSGGGFAVGLAGLRFSYLCGIIETTTGRS